MTSMLNLHFFVFVTLAVVSLRRKASVVEAASCRQDFDSRTAFCYDRGLRFIPNNLLPDLLVLDFQLNHLATLENGTFSRYPRLQVVDLTDNEIFRIDSGAFMPLKDLTELTINRNYYLPTFHACMFGSKIMSHFEAAYSYLESFAGNVISILANRAVVKVSGNKLQKINWTSTHRLSYVDLRHNKFYQLSNNNFVLKNNVDILNLSLNPIVSIEASAISSLRVKSFNLMNTLLANPQWSNLFEGVRMSSITELLLAGTKLGHNIEPGFFEPLKGKHLDVLDMPNIQINVIPDNVFSDLTGVYSFELGQNGLQRVEPFKFNGMTSLRSLSLEVNKITVIDIQGGAWNLSLTQLNLAYTELVEINSSSFQGLTTLRKLDLSENSKLKIIDDDTFANLPFLEELDLSSTNINQYVSGIKNLNFLSILTITYGYCPSPLIHPGYLGRETPSLVNLNLSHSQLYAGMLWDSTNTSSFSGLHSLLRLDLSNNYLTQLPREVFSNLTNLQRLNLRHSLLFDLQAGIFTDLENLLLLNLEENSLSTLSPHLFDQMINLQRLHLKENRLTYLDSDMLKYCTGLRHLDISYNSITSLNRSTFEPLSNLTELNVASNPLVCNCDLKWFPGWLKDSIQVTGSCLDSLSTIKPFRGKELVNFDPSDECRPDIVLYIVLAMVGVALILILGLIYYQRYWIRYRLFLLKICFLGYEEIQDGVDRRDFQYDLAIMHHEADNEWVNENLRPALAERVPDFDRIVCGDEELMLGMHYLDAVHYATERSFKTIVVISREALQDQWFIMKFRTVLDHVNDVRTEKMILLFVEDIPGDELPFLIRLFLSDHRLYLVWPDDERGQNYFWEELIKDLTVNIRCNHLVPP